MHRTRKVTMLKDVPIAADKVACPEESVFDLLVTPANDFPHQNHSHHIAPVMYTKDEKVILDADTAHGLVRDKLAEYDDEKDSSDQEDDDCLTANLKHPDFGTAEHLGRMETELLKEEKKNGQETLSDEGRKLNKRQAARRFTQDRSYEGVAIEQIKNSDYAEGEKPADAAKSE